MTRTRPHLTDALATRRLPRAANSASMHVEYNKNGQISQDSWDMLGLSTLHSMQ